MASCSSGMIEIVADFFSIKVADMYSKRRPANIARPRQIYIGAAKRDVESPKDAR